MSARDDRTDRRARPRPSPSAGASAARAGPSEGRSALTENAGQYAPSPSSSRCRWHHGGQAEDLLLLRPRCRQLLLRSGERAARVLRLSAAVERGARRNTMGARAHHHRERNDIVVERLASCCRWRPFFSRRGGCFSGLSRGCGSRSRAPSPLARMHVTDLPARVVPNNVLFVVAGSPDEAAPRADDAQPAPALRRLQRDGGEEGPPVWRSGWRLTQLGSHRMVAVVPTTSGGLERALGMPCGLHGGDADVYAPTVVRCRGPALSPPTRVFVHSWSHPLVSPIVSPTRPDPPFFTHLLAFLTLPSPLFRCSAPRSPPPRT